MSALWSGGDPDPDLDWDEDWGTGDDSDAEAAGRAGLNPVRAGRTLLRSVSLPQQRMARVPFVLVLIAVFGIGMAGLLMLNTTLQNQAFASQQLNQQATQLTYQQAALNRELDQAAAPQELAERASALGMRANPNPGFVDLGTGKITGYPEVVSGNEDPHQIVKTDAEVQADAIAARQAAAKKAAEKAAKKAAADKAAVDRAAAAKRKADAAKTDDATKSTTKKTSEKKTSGRN